MTPLTFLLVAVAGGLGAVARFTLDTAIHSRVSARLPWGTIIINLSGSLLLGFITGLTLSAVIPESLHIVLGVGLLGGYTTFSTASYDTVRLLRSRSAFPAVISGLGQLVAATALAGLGLWAGQAL